MSKDIVIQDLMARIEQLETKHEELEAFNDSLNSQMNVLNELVSLMREYSTGQKIYNRAINRVALFNLRHNVLIRRQNTLVELANEKMPKTIKESFMLKQVHLIKTTLKDIKHRESFEESSKKNGFDLLFKEKPRFKLT